MMTSPLKISEERGPVFRLAACAILLVIAALVFHGVAKGIGERKLHVPSRIAHQQMVFRTISSERHPQVFWALATLEGGLGALLLYFSVGEIIYTVRRIRDTKLKPTDPLKG